MENKIEFNSEEGIQKTAASSRNILVKIFLSVSIFCSMLINSVFISLTVYNLFIRFIDPKALINGRWLAGILGLIGPLIISIVTLVVGLLFALGDYNNRKMEKSAAISLGIIFLSLISGGYLLFIIIPLLIFNIIKNKVEISIATLAPYLLAIFLGIAFFINYLWYDSRVYTEYIKCYQSPASVEYNSALRELVKKPGFFQGLYDNESIEMEKINPNCDKIRDNKFKNRPIFNFDLKI